MEFNVAPVKAAISLAELEKIDVRVGTILSVDEVSGSEKLVKLTVAFGDHQRLRYVVRHWLCRRIDSSAGHPGRQGAGRDEGGMT